MPRLVNKSLSRYASRDLQPGEEFEASESDARVLKLIGKAEDTAPAAQSHERGRSEEQPDREGSELFAGDQQQRRGRRYNRRDMRAQD